MLVDVAVVDRIRKRRKEVVDGHESEDEEENAIDHTMFQYCSDGEDNRRFDDDE